MKRNRYIPGGFHVKTNYATKKERESVNKSDALDALAVGRVTAQRKCGRGDITRHYRVPYSVRWQKKAAKRNSL